MQPHTEPSNDPQPPRLWGRILIAIGIGVLLAIMIVLHLTGVFGPGDHQ